MTQSTQQRIQWTSEEEGQIAERAAYLLRSSPRLGWVELIGRAQTDVLPANRRRKFLVQFAKKRFSTVVLKRVEELKAGRGQVPDQTITSRKVEFVPTSPSAVPASPAAAPSIPVEAVMPKMDQDVSLSEFFRPTVKALGQLFYNQLVQMLEVELKQQTQQALENAKKEVEDQLNKLVNSAVERVGIVGSAVNFEGKEVSVATPAGKPKIRVAYVGDVTGQEVALLKEGLEDTCNFVLIDKGTKVRSAFNCRVVVFSLKTPHKWSDNILRQNPGCVKIAERSPTTANQKILEAITAPDFN